jgi:hypothetical protein
VIRQKSSIAFSFLFLLQTTSSSSLLKVQKHQYKQTILTINPIAKPMCPIFTIAHPILTIKLVGKTTKWLETYTMDSNCNLILVFD